jgi:ketosteroid isomerase-like protein
MAEDIRWIGDPSLGDPPPECVGREEALSLMRRALGRMPNRNLESLTVSGDKILAVARWNAGAGPEGRDRVFSVLRLRGGRIDRMQDFFEQSAAEGAFASV